MTADDFRGQQDSGYVVCNVQTNEQQNLGNRDHDFQNDEKQAFCVGHANANGKQSDDSYAAIDDGLFKLFNACLYEKSSNTSRESQGPKKNVLAVSHDTAPVKYFTKDQFMNNDPLSGSQGYSSNSCKSAAENGEWGGSLVDEQPTNLNLVTVTAYNRARAPLLAPHSSVKLHDRKVAIDSACGRFQMLNYFHNVETNPSVYFVSQLLEEDILATPDNTANARRSTNDQLSLLPAQGSQGYPSISCESAPGSDKWCTNLFNEQRTDDSFLSVGLCSDARVLLCTPLSSCTLVVPKAAVGTVCISDFHGPITSTVKQDTFKQQRCVHNKELPADKNRLSVASIDDARVASGAKLPWCAVAERSLTLDSAPEIKGYTFCEWVLKECGGRLELFTSGDDVNSSLWMYLARQWPQKYSPSVSDGTAMMKFHTSHPSVQNDILSAVQGSQGYPSMSCHSASDKGIWCKSFFDEQRTDDSFLSVGLCSDARVALCTPLSCCTLVVPKAATGTACISDFNGTITNGLKQDTFRMQMCVHNKWLPAYKNLFLIASIDGARVAYDDKLSSCSFAEQSLTVDSASQKNGYMFCVWAPQTSDGRLELFLSGDVVSSSVWMHLGSLWPKKWCPAVSYVTAIVTLHASDPSIKNVVFSVFQGSQGYPSILSESASVNSKWCRIVFDEQRTDDCLLSVDFYGAAGVLLCTPLSSCTLVVPKAAFGAACISDFNDSITSGLKQDTFKKQRCVHNKELRAGKNHLSVASIDGARVTRDAKLPSCAVAERNLTLDSASKINGYTFCECVLKTCDGRLELFLSGDDVNISVWMHLGRLVLEKCTQAVSYATAIVMLHASDPSVKNVIFSVVQGSQGYSSISCESASGSNKWCRNFFDEQRSDYSVLSVGLCGAAGVLLCTPLSSCTVVATKAAFGADCISDFNGLITSGLMQDTFKKQRCVHNKELPADKHPLSVASIDGARVTRDAQFSLCAVAERSLTLDSTSEINGYTFCEWVLKTCGERLELYTSGDDVNSSLWMYLTRQWPQKYIPAVSDGTAMVKVHTSHPSVQNVILSAVLGSQGYPSMSCHSASDRGIWCKSFFDEQRTDDSFLSVGLCSDARFALCTPLSCCTLVVPKAAIGTACISDFNGTITNGLKQDTFRMQRCVRNKELPAYKNPLSVASIDDARVAPGAKLPWCAVAERSLTLDSASEINGYMVDGARVACDTNLPSCSFAEPSLTHDSASQKNGYMFFEWAPQESGSQGYPSISCESALGNGKWCRIVFDEQRTDDRLLSVGLCSAARVLLCTPLSSCTLVFPKASMGSACISDFNRSITSGLKQDTIILEKQGCIHNKELPAGKNHLSVASIDDARLAPGAKLPWCAVAEQSLTLDSASEINGYTFCEWVHKACGREQTSSSLDKSAAIRVLRCSSTFKERPADVNLPTIAASYADPVARDLTSLSAPTASCKVAFDSASLVLDHVENGLSWPTFGLQPMSSGPNESAAIPDEQCSSTLEESCADVNCLSSAESYVDPVTWDSSSSSAPTASCKATVGPALIVIDHVENGLTASTFVYQPFRKKFCYQPLGRGDFTKKKVKRYTRSDLCHDPHSDKVRWKRARNKHRKWPSRWRVREMRSLYVDGNIEAVAGTTSLSVNLETLPADCHAALEKCTEQEVHPYYFKSRCSSNNDRRFSGNTNLANCYFIKSSQPEDDCSLPCFWSGFSDDIALVEQEDDNAKSLPKDAAKDILNSGDVKSAMMHCLSLHHFHDFSMVPPPVLIYTLRSSDSVSEPDYVRNRMTLPPEERETLLKSEAERLRTYGSGFWPIPVAMQPEELAAAGFYYTGIDDRVQCVFCRGVLRNWQRGDSAMNEHRVHFSYCRLVLGLDCGNIPIASGRPTIENASAVPTGSRHANPSPGRPTNAAVCGDPVTGVSTANPTHPEHAVEACRLQSFSTWPLHFAQSPENLAKAGFYYCGPGDNVKCFYCDGGLRGWKKIDNPWEEHARWFKECKYLRDVKGQAYVDEIQKKYAFENEAVRPVLTPAAATSRTSWRSPLQHSSVQVVKRLGFHQNQILAALERFYPQRQAGAMPTAAELLKVILDMEDDASGGYGAHGAEYWRSSEPSASTFIHVPESFRVFGQRSEPEEPEDDHGFRLRDFGRLVPETIDEAQPVTLLLVLGQPVDDEWPSLENALRPDTLLGGPMANDSGQLSEALHEREVTEEQPIDPDPRQLPVNSTPGTLS